MYTDISSVYLYTTETEQYGIFQEHLSPDIVQ